MIVFDKYVVLPCGNLMVYESGEIIYPKKTPNGKNGFVLYDEEGKHEFFLQSNLLKLKRESEK